MAAPLAPPETVAAPTLTSPTAAPAPVAFRALDLADPSPSLRLSLSLNTVAFNPATAIQAGPAAKAAGPSAIPPPTTPPAAARPEAIPAPDVAATVRLVAADTAVPAVATLAPTPAAPIATFFLSMVVLSEFSQSSFEAASAPRSNEILLFYSIYVGGCLQSTFLRADWQLERSAIKLFGAAVGSVSVLASQNPLRT